MQPKVNIINVFFDAITMEAAVNKAIDFLKSEDTNLIFTANPEIVMAANKDNQFLEVINRGDLVVADGVGVVIGSKWLGQPLPERVAGYDLVQNIFTFMKDTEYTVYFFGAAKGIAEMASKKMQEVHKGLKIVGVHDGYFDQEEEKRILQEINLLKPNMLLIGTGAPRQEKWLHQNKEHLNVNLCIGVGGSFDVMSGQLKRAPKIFIKLGLEWFHRLLMQPTRIKRMIKLPFFLVQVMQFRKIQKKK